MTFLELGMFGAAVGQAPSVVSYNRQGFLFDKGQQVTRNLQALSYHMQKVGLYRQDIRDLAALTVQRTGQYHFVTAIELGICATMMGPGKIVHGVAPEWVLWHQRVTLCTSFAFLVASMWLSMRASLVAASHNARIQLCHLRPPFPDSKTLDGLVAKAEEFEQQEDLGSVIRLPFSRRLLTAAERGAERANEARGKKRSSHRTVKIPVARRRTFSPAPAPEFDVETGVSPRHLRQCQQLQKKWAGCDAYSQLCMSVGTYFLLLSFAFYRIAYDYYNHGSVINCIGTSITLMSALGVLLYMDHDCVILELLVVTVLMSQGPLFVIISAMLPHTSHWWLSVLSESLNALLSVWFLKQGSSEGHLPKHFRPTAYLNVYKQSTLAEAAVAEAEIEAGATPRCSSPSNPNDSVGGMRCQSEAEEPKEFKRLNNFAVAEVKGAKQMPRMVYKTLCIACGLLRLTNVFTLLVEMPTPPPLVRVDEVDSHWSLPSAPSFFVPDKLSCVSGAGADQLPKAVIATNSFEVYQLGMSGSEPRKLNCPVQRHDDILISNCGASGSCYAIVASQGRLWRCQEPALPIVQQEVGLSNSSMAVAPEGIMTEVRDVDVDNLSLPPSAAGVRPLAAVPGGESAALRVWAAADMRLSRVFAAPKQGGAITELSYSPSSGELLPKSALPMPDGVVPEHAEWEALQVVDGRLLFAIAGTGSNATGLAWDLEEGRFAGRFSLPTSLAAPRRGKEAPRVLLCPADASLFGTVLESLSTLRPKDIDLYRWGVPDHLKTGSN